MTQNNMFCICNCIRFTRFYFIDFCKGQRQRQGDDGGGNPAKQIATKIIEGEAVKKFHRSSRPSWHGSMRPSLPPADEGHLRCHDRHEKHIGVERQACHINDGAADIIGIHAHFGHLRAVGLKDAGDHPFG